MHIAARNKAPKRSPATGNVTILIRRRRKQQNQKKSISGGNKEKMHTYSNDFSIC
jgi:hypothetical protein